MQLQQTLLPQCHGGRLAHVQLPSEPPMVPEQAAVSHRSDFAALALQVEGEKAHQAVAPKQDPFVVMLHENVPQMRKPAPVYALPEAQLRMA